MAKASSLLNNYQVIPSDLQIIRDETSTNRYEKWKDFYDVHFLTN